LPIDQNAIRGKGNDRWQKNPTSRQLEHPTLGGRWGWLVLGVAVSFVAAIVILPTASFVSTTNMSPTDL